MTSRLKLHEELCDILGSKNVYYQPPESVKWAYPCIKYDLSAIDQSYANDRPYKSINRYEIIVIDKDPDSEIPYKIFDRFGMCRFDRKYTADNLNHFVITLYY